MSGIRWALSIPINSIVKLTRKKKGIDTTGRVDAHWDDDAENGASFRVGLMICMIGFKHGNILVRNNRVKFIQREDGSYLPCAPWGHKIGSFELEVIA